MGEIRKENLHESLINELEELGNIDLSGKQDKTDESLLTESKDLVGAINELFQNANNGKELIANAIGEPLDASDTFSAMSNDINGLLSTFKTNMMNNGVTVESNDKFKALIDKIATLADNEGKGVQVINGNISECSNYYTFGSEDYYYMTLDYVPTIIYISTSFNQVYGSSMTLGAGECTVVYNSLDDLGIIISITGSTAYGNICEIVPTVSSDGVYYFPIMPYINENNTANKLTECKYTIITVEEDTTLRDSLASILQEEGVSVAPEDEMTNLIAKTDNEFDRKNNTISGLEGDIANKNNTISRLEGDTKNNRDSLASILQDEDVNVTTGDNLASLITKVDEEFDRKNANSGLDIISATELPATGKENQICVVTDNPVDNFIITGNSAESNNDKIVIYNSTGNSNYNTIKNNITYSYNISRVRYQSNNLFSYYWGNNQWNQLTVGNLILFENGEFLNTGITGGFGIATGTTISGSNFVFSGARDANLLSTTTKKINFSKFKKLKVTLYTTGSTSATFLVGSFKDTYAGKYGASFSITGKTNDKESISVTTSATEITIDVSGWTTGYLGFYRSTQNLAPTVYITKITLE